MTTDHPTTQETTTMTTEPTPDAQPIDLTEALTAADVIGPNATGPTTREMLRATPRWHETDPTEYDTATEAADHLDALTEAADLASDAVDALAPEVLVEQLDRLAGAVDALVQARRRLEGRVANEVTGGVTARRRHGAHLVTVEWRAPSPKWDPKTVVGPEVVARLRAGLQGAGANDEGEQLYTATELEQLAADAIGAVAGQAIGWQVTALRKLGMNPDLYRRTMTGEGYYAVTLTAAPKADPEVGDTAPAPEVAP